MGKTEATFLQKYYGILFFLEMNIFASAYESTLSFESLDLCMYLIMFLPIIHVSDKYLSLFLYCNTFSNVRIDGHSAY